MLWITLIPLITLMRVRILIFYLMRIRLFIPMRIRIQILILASKKAQTLEKVLKIDSYSIQFGLTSANWCGSGSDPDPAYKIFYADPDFYLMRQIQVMVPKWCGSLRIHSTAENSVRHSLPGRLGSPRPSPWGSYVPPWGSSCCIKVHKDGIKSRRWLTTLIDPKSSNYEGTGATT